TAPASGPLEISARRSSACLPRSGPDSQSSSAGISFRLLECVGVSELLRRYRQTTKELYALGQVAIPRQGVEREVIAIQMIFQVKHAREARAGKFVFRP